MQLTLKGLRFRRIKIQRRLREFERRRGRFLAQADALAASISGAETEIAKIDTAIAALADFDAFIGEKPKKHDGPRAKRNAHLNEAILAEIAKAGRAGITRDALYDALDNAGVALPSRTSFGPHLSFRAREKGEIASRNFKWMLKSYAPPLPPPAIEEAERIIQARGALSRAEIEIELKTRDVPFTQKSLQTQLSERVRVGRLIFSDGRYRLPSGE